MSNVTVIIPVYNAAHFIKRCIDSFLTQTMEGYDLILVDDGSTDSSGKMCDDYSVMYRNVSVIHQSNMGVAGAREAGLDASRGEYVIFADPDDWVEPTMLEEMVGKARNEEADVVISDIWINSSETTKRLNSQAPKDLCPETVLRQLLMGEMHGSTCNKLYCKETLDKYNVRFPKGINYCEDLWFNCKLFMNQDIKVSYINKAYYHYDCYSNSLGLSRKLRTKSIYDYMAFSNFVFDYLKDRDPEITFRLKRYTKGLAFYSDCNRAEYESIYPEMRSQFIASLKSSKKHWARKWGALLALYGYLHVGRFLVHFYDHVGLPVALLFKSVSTRFSK